MAEVIDRQVFHDFDSEMKATMESHLWSSVQNSSMIEVKTCIYQLSLNRLVAFRKDSTAIPLSVCPCDCFCRCRMAFD